MATSKTPAAGAKRPRDKKRRDRVAEAAGTFEWLLTAFILAFVFRAFAVEAFRIPTGSMADTLMGAHYQLRCLQCGYRYEYGYMEQQDATLVRPGRIEAQPRCPSCGYRNPMGESPAVANGDRILVLKCIYQFAEPKRWDVVVFKNPTNPTENYIKRLIGLPGERVEIIDGDVYINGQIARKPPEIQKELWMPIHDFDFQPVNPNQLGAFNGHPWTPPFQPALAQAGGASAWNIRNDNPTQLVLDCPLDQINTLVYGAPSANDFRVIHAYNPMTFPLQQAPVCSDLMVRFYVKPDSTKLAPAKARGRIGITLSKYDVDYKAWWDFTGRMVIARVDAGQETVLKEVRSEKFDLRSSTEEVKNQPSKINNQTSNFLMKFANVDHQLLFEFNGTELQVDLGRSPTALRRSDQPPRAEIFGAGKLTLSHIGVFRDIYYTSNYPIGGPTLRATEGHPPFQLEKDEFFMLGDNSPLSLDGRFWTPPPVATKGMEPSRAGVVPRHYLVGKAMFVYWPSGFEFPWPKPLKDLLIEGPTPTRVLYWLTSLRWIPNFGQMRFIYGGVSGSTPPDPRPATQDSDT